VAQGRLSDALARSSGMARRKSRTRGAFSFRQSAFTAEGSRKRASLRARKTPHGDRRTARKGEAVLEHRGGDWGRL